MWSFSTSFGSEITKSSSMGLGLKVIQQNLAPEGAGSEGTKGSSTNILFDFGYLNKIIKSEYTENVIEESMGLEIEKAFVEVENENTFVKKKVVKQKVGFLTELNFGLSVSNIGPKIWFQDKGQADPAPTNMKLGIYTTLYNDRFNKISLLADANKLLVARYPAMDWDGNGIISGSNEIAHSDSWYKAIFTSWLDDWYFGGDYDLNNDFLIGGWGCDGDINVEADGSYKCDGSVDNFIESDPNDENSNITNYNYALDADANKVYLEKGSGDSRRFRSELQEMIYNMGIEYWYSNIFVIRGGYIYDYEGKISNPTFGAGLRFGQYGFDFGYTAGEQGHPRSNTMFFSINIGV